MNEEKQTKSTSMVIKVLAIGLLAGVLFLISTQCSKNSEKAPVAVESVEG